MQEKIKEVHDYFKNKIVNGDYEIKRLEHYFVVIVVDGEYEFCLWMTNGYEYFTTYDGQFNFISLDFTPDEKMKAYETINPKHKEFKRNELLTTKRAELEKLENELK